MNSDGNGILLDVDNVGIKFETKRRSVEALRDVNLEVQQGEFISIVGPSGCGKSTLLRAVAGLTVPTSGGIQLRGSEVQAPRQDVGFVFQRPALLPWRDVRGNIMLQAEMRGLDKKQATRRCDELLELTSLTDFTKALPHELSGGMQQRVSLCRALLHDPDVLLMDEPFGALDALTREHLNVELQRLWAQTGMTVLLVTHSVPEAVYLASRVVVMGPRPGRIIEEFEVDLPHEREYEPTLEDPRFHAVAGRTRELLGSPMGGD
ncbi:ABC transporter ATP-binding protein [Gulosibacter chungangensis]|uniref:ABC transporter ATP-binding protein n=1 Tax=Gulosibacter chungangensis TaxID=979746 RepID=A0A7J5B9F5_9MICO|nr:ABC transporter ATP-binding protein [Gulosibacter chungangensis]KAB1642244.1 ABC transporter ATP-binding protein [Gulosibacter chungangensis]